MRAARPCVLTHAYHHHLRTPCSAQPSRRPSSPPRPVALYPPSRPSSSAATTRRSSRTMKSRETYVTPVQASPERLI